MKHNHVNRVLMTNYVTKIVTIVMLVTSYLFNPLEVYAGTPSIAGLSDISNYVEQSTINLNPNITISSGSDYNNGYIEFSLSSASTSEQLTLSSSVSPNNSGAISIIGSSVYVGNGSGTVRIGEIDATKNGVNGQPLRVNISFSRTFTNGSFEDGFTGWTTSNVIWPLQSSLNNTYTSVNVNSGCTGSKIIYVDTTPSGTSFTVSRVTEDSNIGLTVPNGTYVSKMQLNGTVVRTYPVNCEGAYSIFGPSIKSDAFNAYTNDSFTVNWQALAGGDWYDVFGFLLSAGPNGVWGDGDDIRTTMFSERGSTTNGWRTASITIPSNNQYKFEFVSGSYDASGGTVLGAILYVDNISLTAGSTVTVNDAVMQTIARQVKYQNTSADPGSSRTVSVVARSSNATSSTSTFNLTIPVVNHAPTLSSAALNPTYKETESAKSIFGSTSISTVEGAQNIKKITMTASGMLDEGESLNFDGSSLDFTAGSGTTITSGINYTVSESSGTYTLNFEHASGLSATSWQNIINAMSYVNTDSDIDSGNRVFTLTYVQDNGGTDHSGVDSTVLSIASTVSVLALANVDSQTPVTQRSDSNIAATLYASLSKLGSSNPNVYVRYRTTSPVGSWNIVNLGSKTTLETFDTLVNGLLPNTGYEVEAYAINTAGTRYSSAYAFTTPKLTQTLSMSSTTWQAKTYGDSAFSVPASSSSNLTLGLSSSNSNVAVVNGSNLELVGVGTTTITLSQAGSSSYEAGSDLTATLTVSPAPLSITAEDVSKVYGDSEPTLTYTHSGLKYSDTDSVLRGLSLQTMTGAGASVGTHTITASGATADNYTVTHNNGILTVTRAPLTITAEDKAKVFGAQDPVLTRSISGLKYDDSASVITGLSLSTVTGSNATVGNHTITSSGGSADNYSFSHVNGTLSVYALRTVFSELVNENSTNPYNLDTDRITDIEDGLIQDMIDDVLEDLESETIPSSFEDLIEESYFIYQEIPSASRVEIEEDRLESLVEHINTYLNESSSTTQIEAYVEFVETIPSTPLNSLDSTVFNEIFEELLVHEQTSSVVDLFESLTEENRTDISAEHLESLMDQLISEEEASLNLSLFESLNNTQRSALGQADVQALFDTVLSSDNVSALEFFDLMDATQHAALTQASVDAFMLEVNASNDSEIIVEYYAQLSNTQKNALPSATQQFVITAALLELNSSDFSSLFSDVPGAQKILRFESNGGTSLASQNVVYGQSLIAPSSPSRSGYRFVAWYSDSTLNTAYSFENAVMPNRDLTLYAKWAVIDYSIAYDLDGGSGSLRSSYTIEDSVIFGSASKEGYTFIGWTMNGAFVSSLPKGTQGDIQLKAVWKFAPRDSILGGISISNLGSDTASISASIVDYGNPKLNVFKYELTNLDTGAVTSGSLGTGLSANLTGLNPYTTYSVKFIASNGVNSYTSAASTFTPKLLDSDKDGIPDVRDAYPSDSTKSFDITKLSPDTEPKRVLMGYVESSQTQEYQLKITEKDLMGLENRDNVLIIMGSVQFLIPVAMVDTILANTLGDDAYLTLKVEPQIVEETFNENILDTEDMNLIAAYDYLLFQVYSDGTETPVHELGGKIKVGIGLGELQGEYDPNNMEVYFYNTEDGSIQSMKAVYDPATQSMIFLTEHFSYYVLGVKKENDPTKTTLQILFLGIAIGMAIMGFIWRLFSRKKAI